MGPKKVSNLSQLIPQALIFTYPLQGNDPWGMMHQPDYCGDLADLQASFYVTFERCNLHLVSPDKAVVCNLPGPRYTSCVFLKKE